MTEPTGSAVKYPIGFTLINFFEFFVSISPFLLVFLLFLISAFNQDAKGFIYFLCIVFLTTFIALFLKDKKIGVNSNADKVCNIINYPFNTNGDGEYIPYYNTVIITFSFLYLFVPMFLNDFYNVPLLLFIIFIFVGDIYIKLFKLRCTTIPGVLIGIAIGLLFGIIIPLMLYYTEMRSLLFFGSAGDKQSDVCSMKKTTFRCTVRNASGGTS